MNLIGDGSRPIVVVSNRLRFPVIRTTTGLDRRPASGGLVPAMAPVLGKRGGTWFGWPGADTPTAASRLLPDGESVGNLL